MMYTQDYDEQLPANSYPNVNNGNSSSAYSWDVNIAPYAGVKVQTGSSPMIFRCPSDTGTSTQRSYAVPYIGYNPATSTNPNDAYFVFAYDRGVGMAAIPDPSETILLTEFPSTVVGVPGAPINNVFGNWSNSLVSGPTGRDGYTGIYGQDAANPGHQLHFDGWNYLFCDGHVKWLQPQQTLGSSGNAKTKEPGNLWIRIKS